MAKISHAEGGVHCSISVPGEAYRLRVPGERPQQSLGARLHGATRYSSALRTNRSDNTALVSVRRRHDLHDGSDPAQCFARRPRVLSNVHVLPDADTLVPAHEIVATFRQD